MDHQTSIDRTGGCITITYNTTHSGGTAMVFFLSLAQVPENLQCVVGANGSVRAPRALLVCVCVPA